MRFKNLTGVIFFIGTLLASQAVLAQSQHATQQEAILLNKTLQKNHFTPRLIHDKFSEEVFYNLLATLDPQGLYFTDKDVASLAVYKHHIDDELNGNSWKFLPALAAVYSTSLKNAESILNELLNQPLQFTATETVSFSQKDTVNFAADDIALKARWVRHLKYQVLKQFFVKYKSDNAAGPLNVSELLKHEVAIRSKIKTIEARKIKGILEHPAGYDHHLTSCLFNAIASCYDPHTYFLSKTDKENLEGSLSGEELSFGIDLDENDLGEIVVARITPGGPAWKSNELHKDDVLLKLQWDGKSIVDLDGADISEIDALLRSSNSDKLTITFRKANGQIKTISLTKEKVRADENVVKGFILKGERKIGYISLPAFYTEWENPNGSGCANDVAKEIVKLQKENIEGLILDIRFNGGGLLKEGIDLAGIFINEGPLAMIGAKSKNPSIIKDPNRGTVYDGPLVLMINGQSASASELLAGILQDYNRAVIAGSTTYGKATSQIVHPLDTMYLGADGKPVREPDYGFVAVTTGKFYRVTGGSAQVKGIRPDVYLPDLFETMAFREAFYRNAISNDSISKKVMYTPLPALPLAILNEKSNTRIKNKEAFVAIGKAKSEQHRYEELLYSNIPLQVEPFIKRMNAIYSYWESLEKYESDTTSSYAVHMNQYDESLMSLDDYGKEINSIIVKNIQGDIYIEESYNILVDLLNYNK